MSNTKRKDSNATLTSNVHSYPLLHNLSTPELFTLATKITRVLSERGIVEGWMFAHSKGLTATEYADFLINNPKSNFYGNTRESIYRIIRTKKEE